MITAEVVIRDLLNFITVKTHSLRTEDGLNDTPTLHPLLIRGWLAICAAGRQGINVPYNSQQTDSGAPFDARNLIKFSNVGFLKEGSRLRLGS